MVRYRYLLSVLLLFPVVLSWSNSPKTRVQVCQNKDCCQRWTLSTPLPETLQDLLPPKADSVEIESTGCLSQCGKGPNLCIKTKMQEQCVHGVINAAMLAVQLGEVDGKVPSKLLAAVNVMEKAQKGKQYIQKRLTAAFFRVARKFVRYNLLGAICSQHQRAGSGLDLNSCLGNSRKV